MRFLALFTFLATMTAVSFSSVSAQPPREGDKDAKGDKGAPPRREGAPRITAEDIISRFIALDANKDGKITKDEVTEERGLRLFERADADKDGVVTKEELTAMAKQMAEAGEGRRPGAPGGEGRPGAGGPGGRGGPPQPGQIMPMFVQEMLKLTDEQKKELADIQKDVETRINKVLTEDQKKQLQEMRSRMQGGRPGGPAGDRPGARPEGGERPPVQERPAPPKD